MAEEIQIKACPFCGNTEVGMAGNACRTMGPDQETEAEAIRLWNQAGRVEAAKATPFQAALLAQADRIERGATMMLEALLCDRAGCTERADFLERAASNSISDILIELAKPQIERMFGAEATERLDAMRIAAPDLLAACEATVSTYDEFFKGSGFAPVSEPPYIAKCRAAIAKARGQEARA